MRHAECEGAVCPLLYRDPHVGELRVLAEVGANHNDLSTLVSDLAEEVGVRRSCHGYIRTEVDYICSIEPVSALRHVSLLTPDLGTCWREVGVPVVEAAHRASYELYEPSAAGIAYGAHGGYGCESEYPVGAVFFDSVYQGGGYYLEDCVPVSPHPASHPPCSYVFAPLLGVLNYACPRLHRVVVLGSRLPPQL